jgi:hypothetical protein
MGKNVLQEDIHTQEKIVWAIKIAPNTKDLLQQILEDSRLTVQEFLRESINGFLSHQKHTQAFQKELEQIDALVGRFRQVLIQKLSFLEEEKAALGDRAQEIESASEKKFQSLLQQIQELEEREKSLRHDFAEKENQLRKDCDVLRQSLEDWQKKFEVEKKNWQKDLHDQHQECENYKKTNGLLREQYQLMEEKIKKWEDWSKEQENVQNEKNELKEKLETSELERQELQGVTLKLKKQLHQRKRRFEEEKQILENQHKKDLKTQAEHHYLKGRLEAFHELKDLFRNQPPEENQKSKENELLS